MNLLAVLLKIEVVLWFLLGILLAFRWYWELTRLPAKVRKRESPGSLLALAYRAIILLVVVAILIAGTVTGVNTFFADWFAWANRGSVYRQLVTLTMVPFLFAGLVAFVTEMLLEEIRRDIEALSHRVAEMMARKRDQKNPDLAALLRYRYG